ncbi:SUF system Fe-S cluster assembly protein [Limoniibacter endophyticus]|uniref:SUF system Fe-S cluster assembly protein n=2 Tax=Limoniibacter endophyticus TaxID=1565040 RepID=A0A8J3DL06_9HYPH|nr:SUF system Fe-S cluster assembly protein [Limoniibacter endophyticus]
MFRVSMGFSKMTDETIETEKSVSKNPLANSAIPQDELLRMTDDIIAALKTVYDPEIPADIYELGLIYRIDIEDDRHVKVEMTLTAPGCPVAGEMPGWVENAVRAVEGVFDCTATITFDPPWTPDRMSEEAQVATGFY